MSRTQDSPKENVLCLRPADGMHAAAIREIAKSSGIDAWTIDQYLQEIHSTESIVLVAVYGGAVLGFVLGRVVPGSVAATEAEIYNIAVTNEARRKGIGRMLLAAAIEHFISRACECIWLEVRSSNSAAVQFYENNGFNGSSTRRNFYANPVEDALVMRLDLTGKGAQRTE
jgi:[ribosomal protein S18]-alanine N-acetyltransferase